MPFYAEVGGTANWEALGCFILILGLYLMSDLSWNVLFQSHVPLKSFVLLLSGSGHSAA